MLTTPRWFIRFELADDGLRMVEDVDEAPFEIERGTDGDLSPAAPPMGVGTWTPNALAIRMRWFGLNGFLGINFGLGFGGTRAASDAGSSFALGLKGGLVDGGEVWDPRPPGFM